MARDVLLISLDTVRADRLGAYGHDRDTSPFFDRLAAESILFERAYSPAASTVPSHTSLFLSQYVSTHGVSLTRSRPEHTTSLPEILRAAGYRTAGFYSAPPMDPTYGFGRGFDDYEHANRAVTRQATARQVAERAIEWLDDHRRSVDTSPYFLFLHFFDAHTPRNRRHPERRPYVSNRPPPPAERLHVRVFERIREIDQTYGLGLEIPLRYHPDLYREALRRARQRQLLPAVEELLTVDHFERSTEEIRHARDAYDDEIAYLDHELGLLFDQLAARGYLGQALVAIISDHGEMLFDGRNFIGHGHYAHHSVVDVPLLLRLPGSRGGTRISEPVSTIDVAPTILDYLDLDGNLNGQGVSLRTIIEGGTDPEARPILVEAERERALVLGRYKLVESPELGRRSLYDLSTDPLEAVDLLAGGDGEATDVADRLHRLLERMVEHNQALQELTPAPEADVDAELRRALEALGYVL